MDLINRVQLKKCLEMVEDTSDAIIHKIRPYARTWAKFCILFFHFMFGLMIILDYKSLNLFVCWTFGIYSKNDIDDDHDEFNYEEAETRHTHKKRVEMLGHVVTITIFLTRIIPIYFIVAKKHVIPACAILAAFPLILGLHFSVSMATHSFWIVWTSIALVGSLGMLVAESFEVKTQFIAGIPSLGLNRRMSIVTFIGRMTVIAVALQVRSSLERETINFPIVYYLFIAMTLPVVICVIVGYKTKMTSLFLAVFLLFVSLAINRFWERTDHALLLGFHICMFSANLAAIGGLLYITILGPGEYSVDHMKRN